ncbi:hypothetical protein [Nocardiopsis xinjiangensis]|nr:hypothetical protein [Nocardiopsis xinjiangensis]
MAHLPPTPLADAIPHYRRLRELTLGEPAYVLADADHGDTVWMRLELE